LGSIMLCFANMWSDIARSRGTIAGSLW